MQEEAANKNEKPEVARAQGVGVGTLRKGELLVEAPKRGANERDEVFKLRIERFELYGNVRIDVRRGDRRVVRMAQLALEAMEAEINEIEKPKVKTAKALEEYAKLVDDKVAELELKVRELLELRVKHPKTGADLGPVLERVYGLPYEDLDEGIVDLEKKEMSYVLTAIADLGLMDSFAAAVIRLQSPTRAQKN